MHARMIAFGALKMSSGLNQCGGEKVIFSDGNETICCALLGSQSYSSRSHSHSYSLAVSPTHGDRIS